MDAAILSIGDELTLGENLNTNSQWLAAELAQRGLVPVEHRTVDDDRGRICDAVRELAAHTCVLIVTGGLGPTDDDLTRFALNDVMCPGEPLITDEAAVQWLEKWFRGRGRSMPEKNMVQAQRPAAMRFMPNPHGTAPGLAGALGGCVVFALPGPPREMRPMFFDHVVPALPAGAGNEVLLARTVNEFGLGESAAAECLGELTRRDRTPQIGTTASESVVKARIRAIGEREAVAAMIEADCERVEACWRPYAFGRDEATLQSVVAGLLKAQQRTLAAAESCTGGWLAKRIVDLPGSSAVFRGGWVTYSDAMKVSCLGVPNEWISEHGAVSQPVAEAMARGALERSGSEEALAITGIAGPDGGTAEKPVGTVFICVARRANVAVSVKTRQFRFAGDRNTIRDRSVKAALQMLRFALLGIPDDEAPMLWELREARPTERAAT